MSVKESQVRSTIFEAEGLVVAHTGLKLADEVSRARSGGGKIALVPTMGALHEGHLALVSRAREIADHTVVSIFVNPQQFSANEDLNTYPRNDEADAKALKAAGVDLVWLPSGETMYGRDFSTWVTPDGAALGLETDFRPHFFKGVATVVLKLFNQVAPDIAVFGEKDFQQLCVVRQLVRDFDLPIEIASVATIREQDGLALSSRNSYLSSHERAVAAGLIRTLRACSASLRDGLDAEVVFAQARADLLDAGFDKVDYLAARDGETLGPFDHASGRAGRVLAAVWLGRTRLIDNVVI